METNKKTQRTLNKASRKDFLYRKSLLIRISFVVVRVARGASTRRVGGAPGQQQCRLFNKEVSSNKLLLKMKASSEDFLYKAEVHPE